VQIYKRVSDISKVLEALKRKNKLIGYVPTMGALHQGHASLIRKSIIDNDITVCSIFVNPTQFNDKSDLENYPRPIELDIKTLMSEGCQILFLPEVNDIYSKDFEEVDLMQFSSIRNMLEGRFRPGHFDGVISVVKRLFDIVNPHNVYFGQKDFQQCVIINEIIKKYFPQISFHLCPTVRESDGLALSSRNVHLSISERQDALKLSAALALIKNNCAEFEPRDLIKQGLNLINESNRIIVDYLEIVDSETLIAIEKFSPNQTAIAVIAAFCGKTRLVDNMFLHQ